MTLSYLEAFLKNWTTLVENLYTNVAYSQYWQDKLAVWWASVSGKNRRKNEMYNLKRDRRGSRWCAEKDKYNSLLTDVMTGNDFGTQVGMQPGLKDLP